MATPKLEVFQIELRRTTHRELASFSELFLNKCAPKDENGEIIPQTNQFLFKIFTEEFLKKMVDFVQDQREKKAFTVYDASLEDQLNSTIHFHSQQFIIEGTIEGGPYGKNKNVSDLSDKSQKSPVGMTNVILDKFYFFLYIPMDSSIGILMLHSYTDDSITTSFKNFLSKTFQFPKRYYKAIIQSYCPDVIKEEFRRGSVVKKFSFTKKTVITNILRNVPVQDHDVSFKIKIELTSDRDISRERINEYIPLLKTLGFGDEENLEQLETYDGKVYLSKNNKETPFVIDGDFDISPCIYLEGRIGLETDGTPFWSELKDYCFELLPAIKQEIYPQYAVR